MFLQAAYRTQPRIMLHSLYLVETQSSFRVFLNMREFPIIFFLDCNRVVEFFWVKFRPTRCVLDRSKCLRKMAEYLVMKFIVIFVVNFIIVFESLKSLVHFCYISGELRD